MSTVKMLFIEMCKIIVVESCANFSGYPVTRRSRDSWSSVKCRGGISNLSMLSKRDPKGILREHLRYETNWCSSSSKAAILEFQEFGDDEIAFKYRFCDGVTVLDNGGQILIYLSAAPHERPSVLVAKVGIEVCDITQTVTCEIEHCCSFRELGSVALKVISLAERLPCVSGLGAGVSLLTRSSAELCSEVDKTKPSKSYVNGLGEGTLQ
jgi:hypothetical protein